VFERALAMSRLLGFCRYSNCGPVQCCDATPRRASGVLVRSDHILAGEAAFAFDPISSQGVMAAMRTGIHAAACIHTTLRHSDPALAAQFYEMRAESTLRTHSELAGRSYGEAGKESAFWRNRTTASGPVARPESLPGLEDRIRLSPEATIGPVPILDG